MEGINRIWCGKHKLGYKTVSKYKIFGNWVYMCHRGFDLNKRGGNQNYQHCSGVRDVMLIFST